MRMDGIQCTMEEAHVWEGHWKVMLLIVMRQGVNSCEASRVVELVVMRKRIPLMILSAFSVE